MEKVVKKLLEGEVVALPTDTVYGLAAKLEAADALYDLKGRSKDQPLLVLAASVSQIEPYLKSPPASFFELAARHWPGALTLVVPVKGDLPEAVQLEGTCGFRIPNHPLALELLERVGPLAVTSANRSGKAPCKTASEVHVLFEVEVVDGGKVEGKPSTILKWDGAKWVTLRKGSLSVSLAVKSTSISDKRPSKP